MKTNVIKKPDLLQIFDKWVDREYIKLIGKAFSIDERTIRADRIKEWKEWNIECDCLPGKLFINGEEYTLNKIK